MNSSFDNILRIKYGRLARRYFLGFALGFAFAFGFCFLFLLIFSPHMSLSLFFLGQPHVPPHSRCRTLKQSVKK